MTKDIERAARALMNVYGQPGEITEKFAVELSIAVIDSVLLDPSEEVVEAACVGFYGASWAALGHSRESFHRGMCAALRAAGLAITGKTE